MPSKYLILLIITVVLNHSIGTAFAKTPPNPVLAAALNAPGLNLNSSIAVARLSDAKILFELDSEKTLSPASLTKLVTAAVVLEKLGTHYTFKTKFYSDKKPPAIGNLYIQGSGDPYLVSEKLWQLVADFKNMGVTKVDGDLVIDNSLFDSIFRDDSRMDRQAKSRNAYDAPISAFAVNFNTYAIAVAPGTAKGTSANVNFDPYQISGVTIQNNVKTSKSLANQVSINRSTYKGSDQLIATGEIGLDTKIRKIYRSVGDPVNTAGEILKAFLQNAGITVAGKIRSGRVPSSKTQEFYELESYPMVMMINGLNKFSNNFMADMFVKKLGAEFGKAGSIAEGMNVIKSVLAKDLRISGAMVLNNGSGLDTGNRFSANQLVQLLLQMNKKMSLFPEFMVSLPIAGWDGTLDKRFNSRATAHLKGIVRAKTGTLTEPITVVSLAGFMNHPSEGTLVFAIIQNGKEKSAQPDVTSVRDLQDAFLAKLHDTKFLN